MDEFNYVLILLKMSNKHRKKDDSQKKKNTSCHSHRLLEVYFDLLFFITCFLLKDDGVGNH
jgi:hypothetical protein